MLKDERLDIIRRAEARGAFDVDHMYDNQLRGMKNLLARLETMEAAVAAGRRLARWEQYGPVDQPWGDAPEVRSALRDRDRETLYAAAELLEGEG